MLPVDEEEPLHVLIEYPVEQFRHIHGNQLNMLHLDMQLMQREERPGLRAMLLVLSQPHHPKQSILHDYQPMKLLLTLLRVSPSEILKLRLHIMRIHHQRILRGGIIIIAKRNHPRFLLITSIFPIRSSIPLLILRR